MIYEKTFTPNYMIAVKDCASPLRNLTMLELLEECGYLNNYTEDQKVRIKTIDVEFAYYNNDEDLDITGFSIDGKVVRVWNDLPENKLYTVNDDIFISSLLMWGDLESIL
jgi:hypothetical protein|tara:strand:- start:340 stop:669 length:330 start_codon:yes stop_codon:yes gene_type:complete